MDTCSAAIVSSWLSNTVFFTRGMEFGPPSFLSYIYTRARAPMNSFLHTEENQKHSLTERTWVIQTSRSTWVMIQTSRSPGATRATATPPRPLPIFRRHGGQSRRRFYWKRSDSLRLTPRHRRKKWKKKINHGRRLLLLM